MGTACESLERLDAIPVFAAVGFGRMVPSVDWLAKPDTDCSGLSVDMD